MLPQPDSSLSALEKAHYHGDHARHDQDGDHDACPNENRLPP
jgi:hypothetical protein